MFVTFEGLDGSGKTMQANLLADHLRWKRDIQVVQTREPGGTQLGEQLRTLLLTMELSNRVRSLMFAAARAQHVDDVIRPALQNGKMVICDRYYHSSFAYQGFNEEDMNILEEINYFAVQGVHPDLVIYLDVKPEVALARSVVKDAIDKGQADFLEDVRRNYNEMAERDPEKWVRFESHGISIQQLHEKIRGEVEVRRYKHLKGESK